MTKLLTIIFVIILIPPLQCLSTYENSQTFVLDTANPVVSLLIPSGGEIWFSGNYNLIGWNSTDSNLTSLPVALFYSLDGGGHWQTIENYLSNAGFYDWMTPYFSSDETRIRIEVSDAFGNSGADSSGVFSVLMVAPASPQNLRLELVNETDIVISWEDVTSDAMGNPLTPDGYLILTSQEPVDLGQFYFLAATTSTSFLHENAAASPRIFYCIIAYKNDEISTLLPLNEINLPAGKVQWKDARVLLQNIIPLKPTK